MNDEALKVIASTHFGTLATINDDGSPYATPITYTFEDGVFLWHSAPDAVHSQNITRDARVSLSIIEKVDTGERAVYINTAARATGKTSFNEQWKQTLAEYELAMGELDSEKSTPGRFYFRGAQA